MKAQVSMEFIILFSFLFLIFVLFLGIIQQQMSGTADEKDRELLEDYADAIEQEIQTGASVEDGFQRNFTLPPGIRGKEVNATIRAFDDGSGRRKVALVVNYTDDLLETQIVKFLPAIVNVDSDIVIGENCLAKEDGFLYLNSRGCEGGTPEATGIVEKNVQCLHMHKEATNPTFPSQCPVNHIELIRYDLMSGHAQIGENRWSEVSSGTKFDTAVCCSLIGGSDSVTTDSDVILKMASLHDEHVSESGHNDFSEKVYFHSSLMDVECAVRLECQYREEELFSIDAPRDASIGPTGLYDWRLCCRAYEP